ncbi:MAG: hypothetical protein M5U09_11070 [Gammaproteobacteria bacterium]|nr:hypothetical protein [Gammaproteobacteria bacterium]
MRTIDVGTRGYDYADGGAGFYDRTCPPTGGSCTTATSFRALLLAADEMASFIDGALPELVDDSDDDFRFTIELHWPPPDVDRAVEALGRFGSRLAGIVVVPVARARDSATALTAMRRRWPMCVDAGGAHPISRASWRESSVSPPSGGLSGNPRPPRPAVCSWANRRRGGCDGAPRPRDARPAHRVRRRGGLFCDAPAGAAQAAGFVTSAGRTDGV